MGGLQRELTPAAHARIRRQLVLLPACVFLVYGWATLLARLPHDVPVHDFAHFYVLGTIANSGDAHALYDMDAQAAVVQRVIPGFYPPFPPPYGPQVSLFFSPFARLSYTNALRLWLFSTLVAYAGCSYALWRVCPHLHDRPWSTVLLLAASPALHFALGFEQASAIALLSVTAAFLALRANRLFLAGMAIGLLAYKPPLGLAAAFVFVLAREWRIVIGAITSVAAQFAAGGLYWGPAMLLRYIETLRLYVSGVLDRAPGMEPNKFQMHSWRAFFDLLGLPSHVALTVSLVASLLTVIVALKCWRARGPLALRYAVFLLATILIDPHLYAYDLVLLTPAFLLLWDWGLAEPVERSPVNRRFLWLLYFCYFSPLFAPLALVARVQVSVLALSLLGVVLALVISAPRPPVRTVTPV